MQGAAAFTCAHIVNSCTSCVIDVSALEAASMGPAGSEVPSEAEDLAGICPAMYAIGLTA